MFQFVASLFGCTHHHCTFPMTARTLRKTHQAGAPASGKPSPKTYVVCLDCGKEFAYDWEKMKKVAALRVA